MIKSYAFKLWKISQIDFGGLFVITDIRNQLFNLKNILEMVSLLILYRSTEIIKYLVALVKFEKHP